MRDPFLVGIPAAEMRMRERVTPPRLRRDRVTLIEIAVALECSEGTVRARSRREGWIYTPVLVRGRQLRFYPVDELPADVRSALENSR